MCIAIPAEITELLPDGRTARARYAGNTLDINIRLVEARVGDFVLVHAGCAVELLRPEAVRDILDILSELESCHDA